ncbi:MAG: hypothetical protein C4K49_10970 [Candidatus Thorarchaeota archaeon]|nr:MAG: hypothetical protein C4K49_10970 [Candidatus Thorarchaeota archaeon]
MADRWVLNVCPFLHFDNSRSQTYEHYVSIASWNVKSVLDYLDVDTSHKFALDQVTLLEGFKRLFPNYWDLLHQRVLEGRIEIVGGTYVMPDFVIPDGESIARQFLYGVKFFREELGIDVRTGWAVDSMGHPSQMPQILRQCGIDSYYFWRGMPFKARSEFVWKAPDGSRVIAVWLPLGYDCAAWLSENTREAFTSILHIVDETGPRAVSNNLFVPVGGELVPPLPHLTDIAGQWNKTFPDMRMVIANPREFTERAKAVQARMPVIQGGFYGGHLSPLPSGGLSARVKLKIMNRRLETLLYLAELYMSTSEIHDKSATLDNIWRVLLFNQDHNIIRGALADEPFRLAVRRYQQAISQAEEMLEDAVEKTTARIAQPPENPSYVVFNPVPWTRSDFVHVPVDMTRIPTGQFEVRDPEGHSIPYQRISETPETTPTEIGFIASDLPSLGYRVYSVVPVEKSPDFPSTIKSGRNWIESDQFILEFDEFSGAITRFHDKTTQAELLHGYANYISMESDVGDLYRHDTARCSCSDSEPTTLRFPGKFSVVQSGPVRSAIEVSGDFNGCKRRQRVIVYQGLRRVDLETDIDFKGQEKCVRANFPLNVYTDHVTVGSQFAAETRFPGSSDYAPDAGSRVFSALDWVDCTGPETGLCVSTLGLHEFEFSNGLLRITLLRSVNYLSRGEDDDIVETDAAREIGSHSFRIALIPHQGKWDEARVWKSSTEHRLPLIACPKAEGQGELPAEASFLEIDDGELALSCFKPTDDPKEFIVRVYDVHGNGGRMALKFNRDVEGAKLVDMCERNIGQLSVDGRVVRLPMVAHSICTIRVKMK